MSKYAIFIADAHIKPRTWTNWTDLHGDAYAALRGLREYAKANNIVTVLSGGDLLDSNRPCSEDLLELRHFLEAFQSSYIIRGNHDKVEPSFPIVLLPAVEELTPETGKVFIHATDTTLLSGISYAETRQELLNSLHAVKETWEKAGHAPEAQHILMLHCTMKHLSGPGMKFALDENDIAGIFKGYRLLVLVGDVHIKK